MNLNYFIPWKGRLKLLALACLMAIGFNANAINGGGFAPANLLCDVKWNSTDHCFEFTVMVQDDWGSGYNEWIETAWVYVDGANVFDIGGPAADAALCASDEVAHPRIRWQNNNSSYFGRAYIRAQGVSTSTNACPSSWNNSPYTDYCIGDYGTNYYFQCSEIPAYPSHDVNRGSHQYARFRYYPSKIITSGTTISVTLRNIVIQQQGTGQTKTLPDVSQSVVIPMPVAPSGQSITDGTIQSGGGHKFVTSASGATAFQLTKNSYVLDTKTGSSTTFTTKYCTTESEFLDGVSFGFNVRKEYGSGNKTVTYQWTSSQTLSSQRTGVFSGNLDASLETCGKVKLTWKIKNPSTTSINTQGFTLEVKKKSDEGWTEITSGVPAYSAQSNETTNYSYTYTIPDGDLNKGTVEYWFRVKRAFADWNDADLRGIFQRDASKENR
jgi:hypothetical protein